MVKEKNGFAFRMDEHPMLAGALVVILYILFRRISHYIFTSMLPQTGLTEAMHEIVDVIWPFLMVVAFNRTDVYKKGRGRFFITVVKGLALIFLAVFYYATTVPMLLADDTVEWQTPLMMLAAALTMFFVGFREESCFRGIVVNVIGDRYIKDRKGIMITTFVSAALFGVMHMQNLFVGQSFAATLFQTVNAACMGCFLTAVYLRGGNLWAMMVMHGFYDMSLMVKNLLTKTSDAGALAYLASRNDTEVDATEVALKATICIVFILLALFLLRKSKCDGIIERFGDSVISERKTDGKR